ncbi:MAG: hypothetical protein AB7K86_02265 [Rhodospirillales bacterium]
MAQLERQVDFSPADNARWMPSLGEVHFFVRFGGNRLLCRISRDYLEATGAATRGSDVCLALTGKNFDRIKQRIAQLVTAGRYEEGGSVLLKRTDW